MVDISEVLIDELYCKFSFERLRREDMHQDRLLVVVLLVDAGRVELNEHIEGCVVVILCCVHHRRLSLTVLNKLLVLWVDCLEACLQDIFFLLHDCEVYWRAVLLIIVS